MKKHVFVELRLDGGVILESTSPYQAKPTITALQVDYQMDSNELEINWMYLDRWPTVEGGSDVVPFATVDLEHCDEFLILVITPRSSFDVRVEGFSPSLK